MGSERAETKTGPYSRKYDVIRKGCTPLLPLLAYIYHFRALRFYMNAAAPLYQSDPRVRMAPLKTRRPASSHSSDHPITTPPQLFSEISRKTSLVIHQKTPHPSLILLYTSDGARSFSRPPTFPARACHHQRPGMSRPRAAAGSDEPDGAILRACAFLSYLIDPWIGGVAFSTIVRPSFAPDGHMHAARATPR